MYKLSYIALITLAVLSCKAREKPVDHKKEYSFSKYVNPNIGTAHSRWFFYTPGAVPFGMAKLGPSTNGSYGNKQGWEAVGYDSRHNSIEGFACLHEFQIGGFLIAAATGKLQTIPGTLEHPDQGYRSTFDKKDEHASPGYYRVVLKDYGITAELTATQRVGFQRYTFPESDSSYLIFDLGNKLGESGEVKDASVKYLENGTIEGWVITYPEYVKKYQPGGEIKMFFSGKLNATPHEIGTFIGSNKYHGHSEIRGKGAGLYLKFRTKGGQKIEFKSGFSYTSIENARLNLKEEAENVNFDEAKKSAQEVWESQLGKIKVSGSSKENKIKFYTGLYHALLGRGLASDVNGSFPENNGSIGQIPLNENGKPKFQFYNTDAIWGGYWNLTQLWALAWPEYYNDYVQTHLMVYKNAGWLGDGLANSKYVSGVGTNFVSLIIASAYQSGIKNYDVEEAFQAAFKNEVAFNNRIEGAGKMDLEGFIKKGYVDYIPGWNTTSEGSGFSVSHTLEYCYSSYAVAQFAKALGKEKEYKQLLGFSKNWKKLYDSTSNFIRPRLPNGKFLKEFDPLAPWIGFQEGNAYQYTFYVPHDPEGLIALMGQDKFVQRLDSTFTISVKTKFGGADIDAFAGLTYLYNQGNQPNLHIPWLFNYTNQPWLTQKWVRKICDDFYGIEEIHGYGYGQDEDQGQLGAWYVMAALGLFDVKGLVDIDPTFQMGSPIFNRIEIKTQQGKDIIIEAESNSQENVYISSVEVDGKIRNTNSVKLTELLKGSHIKMKMSNSPNQDLFKSPNK